MVVHLAGARVPLVQALNCARRSKKKKERERENKIKITTITHRE